jgi:hypothetical protein
MIKTRLVATKAHVIIGRAVADLLYAFQYKMALNATTTRVGNDEPGALAKKSFSVRTHVPGGGRNLAVSQGASLPSVMAAINSPMIIHVSMRVIHVSMRGRCTLNTNGNPFCFNFLLSKSGMFSSLMGYLSCREYIDTEGQPSSRLARQL